MARRQWRRPSGPHSPLTRDLALPRGQDTSCPVSLDLVRLHLGDLRRTTSPETPFSGLSH